MKILITEPENYSQKALDLYQSLGEVALGPLERNELLKRLIDIDVLVIRLGHLIDSELIGGAQNLKVIVSPTTGLDHIDLSYAVTHNIKVISLKGETEFLRSIPATAELTWGLLLALVRHIPQAHQSVLTGQWDRDAFCGNDLSGKTLGLLGLGRIGEKTATFGRAFGMRVIAYDPNRKDWVEGVERKQNLSALLTESNALLIHVPLEEKTRQMIGAKELDQLPQGAWLVNTSRGAVLDEMALLGALKSRHLGGAALDVVQNELEFNTQSPLAAYAHNHNNLLMTPHIGGATAESMESTELFMAEKFANWIRSNPTMRMT